jgi:hypothetical protein
MKNDAKKFNIKDLEKKFNKIAPFFLFTVIAVIVVVVVILSSHYARKEIEEYSIRNKNVYTYIGGEKFEFSGKITLNRKNTVTNLELNGGTFELTRQPLYLEGEDGVVFPYSMSVVYPAFGVTQYKINYFTLAELDSNNQVILTGTDLKDYVLNTSFVYDGNDIYFFVDETKIAFDDKEITIPALSFVSCEYKGELEIFDYSKKTSEVYSDIKSDVMAIDKNFKLNLSHDSVVLSNSSALLIKTIDKLSRLK